MAIAAVIRNWLTMATFGLSLCMACSPLYASSNSLTTPDSNSRVVVENSVIRGGGTTLLFWTYPDMRDPGAGKPCPLNFYTLTLRPGLPAASPELAAGNVCGNGLSRAGLLSNGDVVIFASDHMERWHAGKQLNRQPFDALQATKGLGVDTVNGGQIYDFAPSGNIVLGIPRGGAKPQEFSGICAFPDVCSVIVGMDTQGGPRWHHGLELPGQRVELKGIWASAKGGALLRVTAMTEGGSLAMQEYLYFIDAKGHSKMTAQIARDDQPDIQQIMQSAQTGGLEQVYALSEGRQSETIKKLAAVARPDGGFDVLLQREAGDHGRTGHFLSRIAANGVLRSEIPLTALIEDNGLENWTDFTSAGSHLILLSRVAATQTGVQTRRKTYTQNVITTIDPARGTQVSRLVPLDRRFLEAAMKAGDEQVQYLENLPGGDPVMITAVGGKPLAVSIGKLSRKTALRLDEGTDDLVLYTEASDRRQATITKEQVRRQRRADRQTRQQQMNADMAASVGMTPEQFASLSKRERKEILVRRGDMDALTAAATRQAQSAQTQQAMPNMPSQDMNAQMAAAMTQVQQQTMQGTGNPAMDAQLQAAMAQVQQAMQASGYSPPSKPAAMSPPAAPANQPAPAPIVPGDNALKINANQQALVEFENRDNKLTTLLIYDRKSGEELFKKDFPDGVIYEFIDFGRFQRPLDQIGVLYKDISGLVLKDLTLVITP